jgi:hypothetical protein
MPGQIFTDLNIDNGTIVLPKQYTTRHSHSLLIVFDGSKNLYIEVENQEKKIEKRDCRLRKNKSNGFIYKYSRNAKFAKKEETIQIEHISSTELFFIENNNCLFESLLSLTIGNGLKFSEWSFLKNWPSLEGMEKLRNYDKFASHELNFFLMIKDPDFFESVVKAHLKNKRQKTLVDFYLLKDFQNLEQFCTPTNLGCLNKFELVILAHGSKSLNPKFSQSILNRLRDRSQLINVNENDKKLLFDTILNSKGEHAKTAIVNANAPSNTVPGGFGNQIGQINLQQISNSHFSNMNQAPLQNCMFAPQTTLFSNPMQNYNPFTRTIDQHSYSIPQNQVKISQKDNSKDKIYEYTERGYHNGDFGNQNERFWSDLASHLVEFDSYKDFFSENFIYKIPSLSEFLVIFSVIDVPFEKISFKSETGQSGLKICFRENSIILTKEIIEKEAQKLDIDVSCSQRFFDPEDRYIYDEEDTSIAYEKPLEYMIVGKIYGSKIAVTNSTTSGLTLSVTYEIPQGAIVKRSLDALKVETVTIASFQSFIKEFFFYFPEEGDFKIYPATVVKNDKIVATARSNVVLKVEKAKMIKNAETIKDVLSQGDLNNIVTFMQTKNIQNPNIFKIEMILPLLKNRTFYESVIEVLKAKGIFNNTVWRFSILHNDLVHFKELMQSNELQQRLELVYFLNNEYLKINKFEVKEYYPLINTRAHNFSTVSENSKVQSKFTQTYNKFLLYLLQKGKVSNEDLILYTQYLLAQDRFEEALEAYNKISLDDISEMEVSIQYDYLTAYIDFVNGYPNFTISKKICEKYLMYPVLTWRNLFIEIANQLAEYEELELSSQLADSDYKADGSINGVPKAPILNISLEQKKIKIFSERITKLTISYYKIDLEVIFTFSPFSIENTKQFGQIVPFLVQKINLSNSEENNLSYHDIPESIFESNLYIEINACENNFNKSEYLMYIPFNLNFHVNYEEGLIKLIEPVESKPVPKIYVKCFEKLTDGTIQFSRDGYTDLRGTFDYLSLSKDHLSQIEKFSIAIISQEYGCRLLKIDPPSKLHSDKGQVKQLVSKKWMQKRAQQKGITKGQYNNIEF